MKINDKVLIREGIFKRNKIIGKIIDYEESEIIDFGHQDSDKVKVQLENGKIIDIENPSFLSKYKILKVLD